MFFMMNMKKCKFILIKFIYFFSEKWTKVKFIQKKLIVILFLTIQFSGWIVVTNSDLTRLVCVHFETVNMKFGINGAEYNKAAQIKGLLKCPSATAPI